MFSRRRIAHGFGLVWKECGSAAAVQDQIETPLVKEGGWPSFFRAGERVNFDWEFSSCIFRNVGRIVR
jgi:hypothetical protein